MSFAVSIFEGELGYSTKAGFIRFSYDDMILWAKAQGRKSPYKRLYTPRSPYRGKTVRRKTKRSLCGRLRLKSQCRCQVVVHDANGERPIYPTDREVRKWNVGERCRKKGRSKVGMWPCPHCPKSKGLCTLYPPAKDLETLRKQKMEALEASTEQSPSTPIDHWPFRTLTTEHFELDPVNPDFAALCEWFDQRRNTDALFQETDLELDAPWFPPDESYTEYDPEEFYRLFRYEMSEDYAPVAWLNTLLKK